MWRRRGNDARRRGRGCERIYAAEAETARASRDAYVPGANGGGGDGDGERAGQWRARSNESRKNEAAGDGRRRVEWWTGRVQRRRWVQ
jgi:hypothetical protein